MAYQRVFVIVLDSVGTGQAGDAAKFDDVGADTLGHVGEYYQGSLQLPNLGKMGLSNLRNTQLREFPLLLRQLEIMDKWQKYRLVRIV